MTSEQSTTRGDEVITRTSLPLKVLVWSDAGRTRVEYTAPGALAARHGLTPDLGARLAGIDGLTEALVAG